MLVNIYIAKAPNLRGFLDTILVRLTDYLHYPILDTIGDMDWPINDHGIAFGSVSCMIVKQQLHRGRMA